ncbi:MAG: dihydrodipicolinate synthase family protein [Gaiellaceae bacterium]
MSDATAGQAPFRGVAVALVSLFDEDGRLLVDRTAELAATIAAEGARAVVVAGSTGEPWFLTAPERAQLIEATRRALPGDVPVVAGTGHPVPDEAVRLTVAARDAGADAVLAISPQGHEDPTAYYAAVGRAAGTLPVLAYHFPAVSTPGVRVELLSGLPVAGIKDSSSDADRLASELDAYDGPVYVGSPLLLATAGALGAAGAIVGLANLDVSRCAAAFAGDLDAQRALVPDHLAAQSDFPRSLKKMLSERRGTPATVRSRPPADPAAAAWPRVREWDLPVRP